MPVTLPEVLAATSVVPAMASLMAASVSDLPQA
jgi:hypothetical protein